MKVSVVIATLKEAGCIERVIKEIPEDAVDEIVVVDAHSPDGTAEIAGKLGCRVIMQKGKGYGLGFRQGIENAAGDVVVLMDGDGSHNPGDIRKLIDKINEGYDCVFASRYTQESHSEDDTIVRSFGNWLITGMVNILFNFKTSDSLFLFTAFRKDVFSKVDFGYDGFEFCSEFLIKIFTGNNKVCEIPSVERKRYSGRSKVRALIHGYKIIKSILYLRVKL